MASAAAAESTHSFMPVIVTRAMLSCAACSRWSVACFAGSTRFGGEATTVVICAFALAAPAIIIAASAARPKRFITGPSKILSPGAEPVPVSHGACDGSDSCRGLRHTEHDLRCRDDCHSRLGGIADQQTVSDAELGYERLECNGGPAFAIEQEWRTNLRSSRRDCGGLEREGFVVAMAHAASAVGSIA
jgi:hypothetical protein